MATADPVVAVAAQQATEAWTANTGFAFSQVVGSGTVCFGGDVPGQVDSTAIDGAGGLLAVTSTCVQDQQLVGFVMTIDAAEPWQSARLDLTSTLTHEFGHALGWEGHHPADACMAGDRPTMCERQPSGDAWASLDPLDVLPVSSRYDP